MKKQLLVAFLFSLCILPPAISSAQVIAAGQEHSLSVCSVSTARSWGLNQAGQLGNGTTTYQQNAPVQVSTVTGIIAVAADGHHSIFLKNNGTVWGCGENGSGSIGDGSTTDRFSPVQVPSLTGITKVECGLFHSLFLKNDSTVWACGKNAFGTLGNGVYSGSPNPTPSQVLLTGVIDISGGGEHSLFLKNDSTVWSCGNNQFGQLGIGTSDGNAHPNPAQVNSLSAVTAVVCGYGHSLFLKNDSTVWACGSNGSGQLGDGTNTGKTSPVQVNSLTGIVAVAAAASHSLFLKNDGTVWACGSNAWGQLGDGTTTNRNTPVQVSGLTGITAVAAGDFGHSLFLKNDGTVWACGRNVSGQLGIGAADNIQHPIPVQVTSLCTALGLTEQQQENSFQIYPNPTTGQFSIALESNNKKAEVTIADITGKVIYSTTASDMQKLEVNTTDFEKGIYVVKIQTADFTETKKLVIEK